MQLANWCSLCLIEEESCDHLIFHGKVAFKIWGSYLRRFRKDWVHPYLVRAPIWEWSEGKELGFSQRGLEIWRHLPFAVCWCLWRERNMRIFEGQSVSLEDIISRNIDSSLFAWCCLSPSLLNLKYREWVFD